MGSRRRLALLRWGAPLLLAIAPAAAAPLSPAAQVVQQARADYLAGDHFAALAAAQRALGLDAGNAAALELNAELVRDAAGPLPSLAVFERALKAAPDNPELLGQYAATLADAGRNADMLRAVRRLSETAPGDRRVYFLQGVLAARAGRDDLALRLMWHLADDRSPALALVTGVLELRSGSTAQAVDRFAALARRQPENLTAQLLLARALLANGEANEVVARFRPLADRGDASPYLLTLVGRAYEELGDRGRAAPYLDRAARPVPAGAWALPAASDVAGEPAATVAQIRQLAAHGQAAEGLVLAGRLNARYPGSADVARVAGDAALLAGQSGQALASYRRAASVRSDAALVQRMAAAAKLAGRPDEAVAILQRRGANSPLDRLSPLALAQALGERGQAGAAAPWLVRAAALGVDDPRVLGALAQVRLQSGVRQGALDAAALAHRLQRSNRAVSAALAQASR